MPPKTDADARRQVTVLIDADTLEAAEEVLGRQIERVQKVAVQAARELELDDTTKDKRTAALSIARELARAGRLSELAAELRAAWAAAGDPVAEAARHLELNNRAGAPIAKNREELVRQLREQTDRVNAADPLAPDQPPAASDTAETGAPVTAEELAAAEAAIDAGEGIPE